MATSIFGIANGLDEASCSRSSLAVAHEDLRELAECILKEVSDRFPLGYTPRIEWRNYRTTAGAALFDQHTIHLSKRLIDTPERLRETLLHEFAHLLAVSRAGRKARNHGPAWQQAMADLGQTPKVRHHFACKRNRPRQQAVYRCMACGSPIIRWRRFPRNRRYVHRDCGGGLQFVGVRVAQATPAEDHA